MSEEMQHKTKRAYQNARFIEIFFLARGGGGILVVGWCPGNDPFFKPSPTIELQYHEAKLSLASGDPSVEVDLRLQAFLRGLSVCFEGGTQGLPHELWLYPGRASQIAVVSGELLPEASDARDLFLTTARRAGNTSLSQLVGMVDEERKWKCYKDRDPCFVLDVQLLKYHAEKLLRAKCLHCIWEGLPAHGREVSLTHASRHLEALLESPMLAVGQLGADILLVAEIQGHLNLMQHGEGPSFPVVSSELKKQLIQVYTNFFKFQVKEQQSDEQWETKTYFGRPGFSRAVHCLRCMQEHRQSEIALEKLRVFNGFRFMMSPDVQSEMRTWVATGAKNMPEESDEDSLEADRGTLYWYPEMSESFGAADAVPALAPMLATTQDSAETKVASPKSASKRKAAFKTFTFLCRRI